MQLEVGESWTFEVSDVKLRPQKNSFLHLNTTQDTEGTISLCGI